MGGFCDELAGLSLMDKPVKYSFIQLVFIDYCARHWASLAARSGLAFVEQVTE